MKQCEKCGQEIVEGAAFCANCGASVSEAQETTGVGTEQPVAPAAPTSSELFSSQPADSSVNPLVSATTPAEQPKKKMDGKMIAMIAVSAICLIVGIVGIVLAVVNGGRNNSGDGEVATSDPGNGGGTVDVVSSGTKVSYAGYEFVIPDGYDYEIMDLEGEEALSTSNSDDYVAVTTFDNSATFTQIESGMSDLTAYLSEENGGIPVDSSVETVDGVKFLCFDLGNVGEADMMYAISEADLYYFQTIVLTQPGLSGKQYLSNVAEVVKSAQKKSGANRAFGGSMLDGVKIPKLRVAAE